jgi:hypothetical protein
VQTRVPRGGNVAVKGWARPATAGQVVALQIQRGDRWKNVDSATVNAKGRARLVAKAPTTKGKYIYRVVAVGKGGVLANNSTDIPIRITR